MTGIADEIAAYPIAPLEQDDVVTTTSGRDRTLHARGAGADHHNLLLHCRRSDVILGFDLVPQHRVDRAGVRQVTEEPR